MARRVPSLVDLCVQVAIDNVKYIGNVGETENHLLERILSHCTLDQLKNIEDKTEDRDLSSVTDKFWKEFYKKQFGVETFNLLIERMERFEVTYKWKDLFEAKSEEREMLQKEACERLRQRYQQAEKKKQSRQVQPCAKVPPTSKKRSYFGGAIANNIYSTRSGIMKKAKLDFVKSREVQNVAAMKNKVVHKNYSVTTTLKKSSSLGGNSYIRPAFFPSQSVKLSSSTNAPSYCESALRKIQPKSRTTSSLSSPSPSSKLANAWKKSSSSGANTCIRPACDKKGPINIFPSQSVKMSSSTNAPSCCESALRKIQPKSRTASSLSSPSSSSQLANTWKKSSSSGANSYIRPTCDKKGPINIFPSQSVKMSSSTNAPSYCEPALRKIQPISRTASSLSSSSKLPNALKKSNSSGIASSSPSSPKDSKLANPFRRRFSEA